MRKIVAAAVVVALSALVVSAAWAQTQAKSSLTANAKGEHLSESTWIVTVSGKVASPNPACRANRAVRVEFVFPTPPNIVVKAKTAAAGTYTAAAHLNPGADEADTATRIKVIAAKSTASGVTCKEATKTIPVPAPEHAAVLDRGGVQDRSWHDTIRSCHDLSRVTSATSATSTSARASSRWWRWRCRSGRSSRASPGACCG